MIRLLAISLLTLHSGSESATAPPQAALKVLLIGKDRDHPPQSHEYMNECRLLAKCLEQNAGIETVVSNGWPTDPSKTADVGVIVLYTAMGGNVLSDGKVREQVEAMLDRGVGLVMIHWSTGADDGAAGQWQLDHLGGWFGFAFSKIPVVDSTVHQVDADHPINRGWRDFPMRDEYYTDLKFHANAKPLWTAAVNGREETVAWTFERPGPNGGRSFGTVCGHFHDCFKIESFRRGLVNAILWAGKQEVPANGAIVDATEQDLTLDPDPRTAPPGPVDDKAWSDRELPIRDGLALWLDAQAQVRAHAAYGLNPPRDGEPIGVCFDGSGQRRHVVQRHTDAQPSFRSNDRAAAIGFDGRDDALEALGIELEADAFTVFIVAAPYSNQGSFRGLLSLNRHGRRDYETGFTIDLGPAPSVGFETLNVEGQGFGGAPDLMTDDLPFGITHFIDATLAGGPGAVQVAVNGKSQTARDRTPGRLATDELTVGARCYSNISRPGYLQGFFHGTIAEILVYARPLTPTERDQVRAYLRKKHEKLDDLVGSVTVPPPPVQMLVPGFEAYQLPVELTNLNNVRYRADGTLVGLGYNGNIYLIKDTNKDGFEDRAELFWNGAGSNRAPIGMALSPPGDLRGQGIYIAAKGKIVFIADRDGDDRGDEEIVLASGWTELPHGVDALGVAVDREGAVYFGLGAANFTNAYLIDASGHAAYDLASERGTIQRIAPDGKSRAIIATGIRFPVALRFNSLGDLFCTDQEGATWLPNGNPFDELLWIREGRHYGFPPRHSRFLPSVIDEPSVYDYTPQHQSTCGFVFNEPVSDGGPVFGPSWWRGNALVCGYSRGKLFRTELVKSSGEYVARNHVIAVFDTMPVDCCVAPDGSLIVATHSGFPDWGSGPEGTGRLYKIRYEHPEMPQPIRAVAQTQTSITIEFDRALDPALASRMAPGATIEARPSARAGDQYESLRPGYAVVAAQLTEPRQRWVAPVKNSSRDPNALVIETTPLLDAIGYIITLPWPDRGTRGTQDSKPVAQRPEVGVDLALSSVVAAFYPEQPGNVAAAFLTMPHADLEVARALTVGTSAGERFWPLMETTGTLALWGSLRLDHLLRPAVQLGSKIDDNLPSELPELVWEASQPFTLKSRGRTFSSTRQAADRYTLVWKPEQTDELVPFRASIKTGPGTRLTVRFRTQDDSRLRPLALARFLNPTARLPSDSPFVRASLPPEVAAGSSARGKLVFEGEKARCSLCHTIRGTGGKIGPDLSNLDERDYESVFRDIKTPSAALNPDHLTYSIALRDGRILTGAIRSQGDQLHIGDADGRETTISKSDIEEMRAVATSTMPEKLLDALTPVETHDLFKYLLDPDTSR